HRRGLRELAHHQSGQLARLPGAVVMMPPRVVLVCGFALALLALGAGASSLLDRPRTGGRVRERSAPLEGSSSTIPPAKAPVGTRPPSRLPQRPSRVSAEMSSDAETRLAGERSLLAKLRHLEFSD